MEHLFDPLALILVFGGTGLATLVSSTREDLVRAVAALRPLVRARPARDAVVAERAVRQIQRIARHKGLVGADRVRTPVEFVGCAARRLAEADSADAFAAWAGEALGDRRTRHEAAIAVWRAAAETAPAMGMIGTVLGLVAMFARMSDPAAMGPAMATAMLTTFYGLMIAAGLAGPVATRLERLSVAERRWQERVATRLEALARAEQESMRVWRDRRRAGAA